MKFNIGIVGAGWVGTACDVGFSELHDTTVRVYDKFKDSESLETVVFKSDIIFLCVPTPMNKDGSCDTSIVKSLAQEISSLARKEKVIVVKSTCPPGTTDYLQLEHPEHIFIFNPEFLTEKRFIDDFLEQEFIILGAATRGHSAKLLKLYESFTREQHSPAIVRLTDARTAELAKYTINCFLATKLSFLNEMYQICQASGIEYDDLRNLLLLDERIGRSHMNVPGPDGELAWSGGCFPKDVNSLSSYAKSVGVDPLILNSTWQKNLQIREHHDWENLAQVTGNYAQVNRKIS